MIGTVVDQDRGGCGVFQRRLQEKAANAGSFSGTIEGTFWPDEKIRHDQTGRK